ncbi:MAG: ribbon-helix-helix protein, CopG family [Deltaproteobacteria bacterium]|nr:ribbon-helix-helix protein, CopG family [Deltaproteobacteria bacterium]
MSTALSIRLPDELEGALEKLARVIDRPRSYLVRKAIETYLAEYADYQIALDRLRDKDDETIDGVELRKRLGL